MHEYHSSPADITKEPTEFKPGGNYSWTEVAIGMHVICPYRIPLVDLQVNRITDGQKYNPMQSSAANDNTRRFGEIVDFFTNITPIMFSRSTNRRVGDSIFRYDDTGEWFIIGGYFWSSSEKLIALAKLTFG